MASVALPMDEWFAGFFDGEGNVYVGERYRGSSVSFPCTLQVTQKRKAPLRLFQRRFGGTISPTRTPKACWRWRICAQQAERCARVLRPMLRVKRKQIGAFLKVRDLTGPRGTRATARQNRERRRLREAIQRENHR